MKRNLLACFLLALLLANISDRNAPAPILQKSSSRLTIPTIR